MKCCYNNSLIALLSAVVTACRPSKGVVTGILLGFVLLALEHLAKQVLVLVL